MISPYRIVVRILISGIYEVNTIARLVAPVALGLAISGSVYAAVYIWRIAPVAKKFPCILRQVSVCKPPADNVRLTSPSR